MLKFCTEILKIYSHPKYFIFWAEQRAKYIVQYIVQYMVYIIICHNLILHVCKFTYKFNGRCRVSNAVKVVERTLGRSMVACFGENAIKTNGLQDNGFVWVASYFSFYSQCKDREVGLLGTRGVIWDGLQNTVC